MLHGHIHIHIYIFRDEDKLIKAVFNALQTRSFLQRTVQDLRYVYVHTCICIYYVDLHAYNITYTHMHTNKIVPAKDSARLKVCIRAYMYMYVCIITYTYMHTNKIVPAKDSARLEVCIRAYMYMYLLRILTCIQTRSFLKRTVQDLRCVYVNTCICMYVLRILICIQRQFSMPYKQDRSYNGQCKT
jgi:hypothetical protein